MRGACPPHGPARAEASRAEAAASNVRRSIMANPHCGMDMQGRGHKAAAANTGRQRRGGRQVRRADQHQAGSRRPGRSRASASTGAPASCSRCGSPSGPTGHSPFTRRTDVRQRRQQRAAARHRSSDGGSAQCQLRKPWPGVSAASRLAGARAEHEQARQHAVGKLRHADRSGADAQSAARVAARSPGVARSHLLSSHQVGPLDLPRQRVGQPGVRQMLGNAVASASTSTASSAMPGRKRATWARRQGSATPLASTTMRSRRQGATAARGCR